MLIVSNDSEGNSLQPTTIPSPNQSVAEIRHFFSKKPPLLTSGFLISYSMLASIVRPRSMFQHVTKNFLDHNYLKAEKPVEDKGHCNTNSL